MKKSYILIMSCFAVLIPIGYLTFFLSRTRTLPVQTISVSLVPSATNSDHVSISEKDLDDLSKKISESLLVNDQTKLIGIFEDERSKYIELLTVLATILTVFTLFSIVIGIVDRNEVTNLKKQLMESIEHFNVELSRAKLDNTEFAFNNFLSDLRNGARYTFDDKSLVDTYDKFQVFASQRLSSFMKKIKAIDLPFDEKNTRLSIFFCNYLINSRVYVMEKYRVGNFEYNCDMNPIVKDLFTQLLNTFDKEEFVSIIRDMKDLGNPPIKWGVFTKYL